jgi:hypothetical protein
MISLVCLLLTSQPHRLKTLSLAAIFSGLFQHLGRWSRRRPVACLSAGSRPGQTTDGLAGPIERATDRFDDLEKPVIWWKEGPVVADDLLEARLSVCQEILVVLI